MALRKSNAGRSALAMFIALVAVAAGCSSASTYSFPLDGGAGDGASSSIVPTGDGGTTKKKDGGKDAAVEPDEDSGDDDASVITKKDSSVTTTCAPGSVTGFSPSWVAPATLHQNKCTAANVALAVQCMFDTTANQTTCDAFTQNATNKPCMDCIFTQQGVGTPGPILVSSTSGRVNIAGCVARMTSDVSSTGCGAKFDAANQCSAYACEPNCTDTSSAGLSELQQCEQDALNGGCSTYNTAASCVDTVTQSGGAAEACANGNTFLDLATNVAKLFCAN